MAPREWELSPKQPDPTSKETGGQGRSDRHNKPECDS